MFLARLAAFALGLVFAWAAGAKVLGFAAWKQALAGYRLAPPLRLPTAFVVPVVEAGIAALFFSGATRIGASAALASLALFSLTIVRAQAVQGSRLPCGCFGSNKERDPRFLLARNTVLATGAGALLVYGRDVPGYPSAPSGDAWPAAALVALGSVLIVWVVTSVISGMRRDVA